MDDFTVEELVRLTYNHLNTYIKSADQKASILATGILAFLGLYSNALNPLWQSNSSHAKVFALFTALTGILALVFAGLVIYPRTPPTDKGFFLWKSILNRDSVSEYRTDLSELDDEGAYEELIDEVYQLAKVSDRKFQNLQLALILSGLMLVFATITAFLVPFI